MYKFLSHPVAEVVVSLSHHRREVRVTPHQWDGLAGGHVEVPGDLVEAETSVDAAGVVGLVRVLAPEEDFGAFFDVTLFT